MSHQDNPSNVAFAPQSRLYLSKLESPPATILAHLIRHFARIPAATWRDRVARGLITLDDGTIVEADSQYRHGVFVLYRKEVPFEPDAIEDEVILYQDRTILVVDKPHGMVVTPAGDHVERSLLVRLQRKTGLTQLAPVHRLDRETAGVLLFAVEPSARGPYHRLFSKAEVDREYVALAHVEDSRGRNHWRVENRIESGTPWYRQRIVSGAINAISEIELIETRYDVGLFQIRPRTGKKHQIRVHMASIGCPIVADPLYPVIREKNDGSTPLQLLAKRLAFIDPLSGKPRSFGSLRELDWGSG